MSLHSCLLSADVSRRGRQGKVSAVRWGQVSLLSSPLPTHPAPCMPLLSFTALNLSGCSFWWRRIMLSCAEVPEGQSKRHCGGWEKGKKKSLSQVHLCAFVHVLEPATLCPLPPRKAELGDGGGALQPALCWLPLTREREITVLAGTPRQAVPAQLASPACHPPGEGMDAASRPWHHSYTEQLQREPWAFLGAIQPWLSLR